MGKRLDQARLKQLEPERAQYALLQITNKGYDCTISEDGKKITFERAQEKTVVIFPFTGWWSGKGIGSGRGIHNLLKLI